MTRQWWQPALWVASGAAVATVAGASLYAYYSANLGSSSALSQPPELVDTLGHDSSRSQPSAEEEVLQKLCMDADQLADSSKGRHAGRNGHFSSSKAAQPATASTSPLPPPTPAAMQRPARLDGSADVETSTSALDVTPAAQKPPAVCEAGTNGDHMSRTVLGPCMVVHDAAAAGAAAGTRADVAQVQSATASSAAADTQQQQQQQQQQQDDDDHGPGSGHHGSGGSLPDSRLHSPVQQAREQQHLQEQDVLKEQAALHQLVQLHQQQPAYQPAQQQQQQGAVPVQQPSCELAGALQAQGPQQRWQQRSQPLAAAAAAAASSQQHLVCGQSPAVAQADVQQQQVLLPSPPLSPKQVQPRSQRLSAQLHRHQQLGQQPQPEEQQLRMAPRLSMDSALQQPQAGDGARQHRSFNTARHAPSLDTTVASAAVARSLEVQYKLGSTGSVTAAEQGLLQNGAAGVSGSTAGGGGSRAAAEQQKDHQQQGASLAASCSALCVQHCAKLQDAAGRETTVLDIGCGTGGCCFELAASFSHVLGIDGDLLNITAAKELKAQGELCFRPVGVTATAAVPAGPQQQQQQAQSPAKQQEQPVCVVRVPDEIDRDRVRFWQCPLPQLPPKLQPLDAVLVEDVDGRLGPELESVCQQLPALVNPEGVCVVVLGAAGAEKAAGLGPHGCASLEDVKAWLSVSESRLEFVQEVELLYSSGSGAAVQQARAGVWLQH